MNTTTTTIVTKDSLIKMLNNPNPNYVAEVVGRALVGIFKNQTDDEKSDNKTTHHNGIGFTGADAHSGSISAKYFIRHGFLKDWQVSRWVKPNKHGVPRIAKYHRQLNSIANQKVG